MRTLCRASLAALLVTAIAASAVAHDQVPEVSVYVKSETSAVLVLVRIPTVFLAGARLPVRSDGYFDLQELDGALTAIAADVTRNLDLMDGGRAVPASRVSWTLSQRSDPSFATFEGAAARFAVPRPSADARIDPAVSLVDLKIEYPPAAPGAGLSLRMNGLRIADRPSRNRLQYVAEDGAVRTLVTSGEPRRITLEPQWRAVVSTFARLGFEQLTLAVLHLFFILVLAIPPRSMRAALMVFGTFAIALVGALAASAALGAPDAARLVTFQTMAAAALVVAGLQNITAPRQRWVTAVAAIFGGLDGLVLGAGYGTNAALAGSHALAALASFTATILAGSLWLLLVGHPVAGLAHRSRLTERWAVVILSAIPIHAGLHGLWTGI